MIFLQFCNKFISLPAIRYPLYASFSPARYALSAIRCLYTVCLNPLLRIFTQPYFTPSNLSYLSLREPEGFAATARLLTSPSNRLDILIPSCTPCQYNLRPLQLLQLLKLFTLFKITFFFYFIWLFLYFSLKY